MKPGATLAKLFLVLFGFLLLVSCGRKTVPVPPQTAIPGPITKLEYQLDEKGMTLSWEKPLLTDQGKKLARIESFLVERAEYPVREFCRECPVRYHQVASLSTTGENDNNGPGSSYRDEDLRPGHIYIYRVLTRMGWQVTSLPSRPVLFTWQRPLEAVSALRTESGDQQVVLYWQAPTKALDLSPVTEPLQYEVFRSIGGGKFMPITRPVQETTYKDVQLANGVEYRYKVRSARVSGGTGAFSAQVLATPRDLTPPPPPQNLNVLVTPEGIRIFWEPLVVSDLAGYQIFRRSEDEELRLLDTVGASRTSFVDRLPGEQKTYYYKVRAFDRAEPANMGSFSEETRTGQ